MENNSCKINVSKLLKQMKKIWNKKVCQRKCIKQCQKFENISKIRI